MTDNLISFLCLAMAFLMLFVSAEVLYHKFKLDAEITRKYVHISTGILTMLFPFLLTSHWEVLLLCSVFLLFLFLAIKLNMLPSINAIGRKSRGSLLYPIIVYGCFVAYQYTGIKMMYYIPIIILAMSDPIAALIGKYYPLGRYQTFGSTKTLSGSLGFLLSAFIISLILIFLLEAISLEKILIISLTVSIVTTILEGISHKGYDNLTIPAGAVSVLVFYNFYYQWI